MISDCSQATDLETSSNVIGSRIALAITVLLAIETNIITSNSCESDVMIAIVVRVM